MRIRLPGRRSIAIHAFPSSDHEFVALVDAVAAEARGFGTDPADLRTRVEARLRQRYPKARVVPRLSFAGLMPDGSTWYAYRDGQLTEARDGDEPPSDRPLQRRCKR